MIELIFGDEWSKFYFDNVNNQYLLWVMIPHVMYYDIYVKLRSSEVDLFYKNKEFKEHEFQIFANKVAFSRPGLVGRYTEWDNRIVRI